MFASSKSSPGNRFSSKDVLILAVVVLASLLIYLGLSAMTYRIGFPLDDSWIHQTYARNLALRGEWSFVPGEISAGSTSPLWTALLGLGFILHLSPYVWTFLLGVITLCGSAIAVELILRQTLTQYQPAFPWAGSLVALEWHLVWAAFSGMETGLYIFLVLCVMNSLLTGSRNYLLAGILVGVSLWVRPDGMTLLAPLGLLILLTNSTNSDRLRCLLRLFFGFMVFFFPYLLFNLVISGTPMPNTFYAKQAEYVGWNLLPFGTRILYFSLQFFQGVSLVLIPGFVYKIYHALRERNWGISFAAAWVVGYSMMYLLRLPVYQHGRYHMPSLAIFLLIGISGFLDILAWFNARQMQRFIVASVAVMIVSLVISFGYGGLIYSQDVAFIESQMVETARWVSKNIPEHEKIAAHDIGALGYFGNHSIVDLAGLVTPEIIPIMNEDRLISTYLDNKGVEYLVAFMDWKPGLKHGGKTYFIASEAFNAQSDFGSMAVFGWSRP